MIVVNNTKQLENMYNIQGIRDDEKIKVLGGLANKSKYNDERYQRRVCYTGREIKQIIKEMRRIEYTIPNQWNDWQRAKYIYEIIASNIEYNYNKAENGIHRNSDLTVLLSRKGVCAGYSLLYQEMMERQGISCDYIRGTALSHSRKNVKHAWNVLTIDGISIPVDITWDSNRIMSGRTELSFFGNAKDFFKKHVTDNDEKQYSYTFLENEFVKSIHTDFSVSMETPEDIIRYAIEKTYEKMKRQYGDQFATRHVKAAIYEYIKEGNTRKFTRDGGARENIKMNISPHSMLSVVINSYVQSQKNRDAKGKNVLDNAVQANLSKYPDKQIKTTLQKYIVEGVQTGFTRQNGARAAIIDRMTQEQALEILIEDIVEKELEQYSVVSPKTYFYASELEEISLPEKEKDGLIKSAIAWMQKRFVKNTKNTEYGNKQIGLEHRETSTKER